MSQETAGQKRGEQVRHLSDDYIERLFKHGMKGLRKK
jgi:hypothetical protein